MRLATVRTETGTTAARLAGESAIPIDGAADVGALLQREDWQARAAAADAPGLPWTPESTLQPVLAPGKVLCVGLNYRGHIEEMGRELPAHPTVFAKFAETLTGPFDPVETVPSNPSLDWEGELVAVIGAPVRRASRAEAERAIAGFTIANDISMRDWQYRSSQWLQGKFWERSTPVGPVLVTPDELDLAAARLTTTVNGRTMQDHALADLLFDPADLVAYLSEAITLRPGDMILTGTPGGVGHAREPRIHLRGGDTVAVSIDGIGEVRSAVVDPA